MLSYSVGATTATIASNGNTLTTAVDIDLTSGEQELRILYNDGANDEVTVLVYDIFTTADMVSATSGGTFSGAITFSSTVS